VDSVGDSEGERSSGYVLLHGRNVAVACGNQQDMVFYSSGRCFAGERDVRNCRERRREMYVFESEILTRLPNEIFIWICFGEWMYVRFILDLSSQPNDNRMFCIDVHLGCCGMGHRPAKVCGHESHRPEGLR